MRQIAITLLVLGLCTGCMSTVTLQRDGDKLTMIAPAGIEASAKHGDVEYQIKTPGGILAKIRTGTTNLVNYLGRTLDNFGITNK